MWNIHLVENTIEIDEKCQKALEAWYLKEFDYEPDYLVVDGKLNFNHDHHEHRDYMSYPKFAAILKKHKVNGRICWFDGEASLEPRLWGYDFKNGKMTKLEGGFIWERE